ncbi:MAG: methyltransferase domain-containing protein [Candidatus Latescibacteria bacterium]|nr:methyltransferase domain-containing protein [Candidatus Latescibacterota bacterium]
MQSIQFPLTCPVCHEAMSWSRVAVACPNRHSFDIAREGYVNLYRTSRKSENQPGDSREMLVSRRSFLDTDQYAPLSDCLNQIVSRLASDAASDSRESQRPWSILDVGCGEGYYLNRMQTHLTDRHPNVLTERLGIDISKEAVRMAARRYKDVSWCVANAADYIPCGNGSVDLALSVFAPRFSDLLHRVIAPEGRLVTVIPGPHHLAELTALAMADSRDTGAKEQETIAQFRPNFDLMDQQTVRFEMLLNMDTLWDLYRMIPVYWRSTKEAQERIRGLDGLLATAHFSVLTFRPDQPSGRPA